MSVLNRVPQGAARVARGGKAAMGACGKRLRMDRRGSVAIIIGLSTIPLLGAVGVGIDLTRIAAAKAKLQSSVDAAALAGAVLYTDAGKNGVAQAAASRAFQTYTQTGDFSTVTLVSVAAAPGTGGTGYQVAVTGSAVVPTTLMKVAYANGDVTVTTTATAALPWTTPKFSPPPWGGAIGTPSQVAQGGNTQSNAWDWNAAFAYAVPMVNGVYDFTKFPPFSQFVEIASNCSSAIDSTHQTGALCDGQPGALPPVTPSFAPLPDQPIAFMFLNMNNGQWPAANGGYGGNQWGLQKGQYAVLLTAPIASGNGPAHLTDNSVSILNGLVGGGFNLAARTTNYASSETGTLMNCALQIALVSDTTHPPTAPPVTPGVCYALNDTRVGLQYANLSCNQMAGRTFMYFWNDMGAGRDDYDYMNLVYQVYCDKSSTNPGSGGTSGTPSTNVAPAKLIQ